jgi:hypothetical protein
MATKRRAKRPEGVKVVSKVYGEDHPISVEKAQSLLATNLSNRPLRKELVKRYAIEILRRKWRLNGETIVVDWEGHLISGQHRLHGLLLAQQMLEKFPEKFKKYGWKGTVTMEGVIITGIDPDAADTVDLGQKRTGGDVLYRQSWFNEKEYKPSQIKTLSNDLASAVRLVWLRNQQMVVSDAPKFPHSAMIDFLADHKDIKGWVKAVFDADNGGEKNVSVRISRATLAAFLYLYEQSFDDSDEGDQKASDFLNSFASGADLHKGDPVFQLREALTKIRTGEGASSGASRDTINALLVKAMLAHKSGEEVTAASLKPKKGEDPRLGGLDVYEEDVTEYEEVAEEEEAEVAA